MAIFQPRATRSKQSEAQTHICAAGKAPVLSNAVRNGMDHLSFRSTRQQVRTDTSFASMYWFIQLWCTNPLTEQQYFFPPGVIAYYESMNDLGEWCFKLEPLGCVTLNEGYHRWGRTRFSASSAQFLILQHLLQEFADNCWVQTRSRETTKNPPETIGGGRRRTHQRWGFVSHDKPCSRLWTIAV